MHNNNTPKENNTTQLDDFSFFLASKAKIFGFCEAKKKKYIQQNSSISRAKRIINSLINNTNLSIPQKDRVLDVGCGFGNLLMVLSEHFNQVFGIDINEEKVEWARKRVPQANIICSSAVNLPYPDEFFDLITCTDVFEHIPHQEQKLVASEIVRVLKSGGIGFISVPNKFQIRDEHNDVLFSTWFPHFLRQKYVQTFSKNKSVCLCWERTGYGWQNLFQNKRIKIIIKPIRTRLGILLPAARYELFLTKS